jgi:uncharacterized membrane protein YkoI
VNNRTTFAIAAGLTAFILALVGGLAFFLAQGSPGASVSSIALAAQVATNTPQADPAASGTTIEEQVQALVNEREAAYRDQLQRANQQLIEANAKLEAMDSYISSLKAAQVPTSPPTQAVVPPPPASAPDLQSPATALSADQATAIALQAEPGALVSRAAELVSFKGVTAFEVGLDSGMVYVDANAGQLLYDSAVVNSAPAPLLNVQPGREHEEGGEDD